MAEEPKSGYLSTSFVLCAITIFLTLSITFGTSLVTGEFFEPGSKTEKIVVAALQAAGLLSAGLTAAGYTIGNVLLKVGKENAAAKVVVANEEKQTAQIEKNKSMIDLETAKANLATAVATASASPLELGDPPQRSPFHTEG